MNTLAKSTAKTAISVGQFKQERGTLHSVIPRFVEPELERRYRDDRLTYRLSALRVSLPAGIAIWLLFGILDLTAIHDPSVPLFYIRIIGTVSLIPMLVAALVLKPGRWMETVGFIAIAVQLPLLSALIAVLSPSSLLYFQPTDIWILIGVASFVLCGVSFVEGLILAIGTIFAFFVSVIVFWPEPPLLLAFHFAWLFAVITFVAIGSFVLDRTQRVAWLQDLELQRAEAQIRTLLHNVLPPSIATRKLAGESPIADHYDEASLLFADVVNFTSLSARLRSSQVVGMLNDLFSHFDRIVARNRLEKIKTIGDCYMVAAGIPQPLAGHVKILAHAAVEMLQVANKTSAPDGSPIAIRIGIHTGPVTAGVIGEAKFIFDVWGDTVNTASRMESHGAAGRIQVTDAVRAELADEFDFAGPNIIEVKGKGPTRVWFLQLRGSRSGIIQEPGFLTGSK
jgi:adenylate cyclase